MDRLYVVHLTHSSPDRWWPFPFLKIQFSGILSYFTLDGHLALWNSFQTPGGGAHGFHLKIRVGEVEGLTKVVPVKPCN